MKNYYRSCLNYIRRFCNQRHRYDFSSENNGWRKYGSVPVWGNAEIGTMFDPFVFVSEDKFKMLVSARRTKSLMLVESADGIDWQKPRVLLKGRLGMWDEDVSRGCLLLYNDEKYYLWYSGQLNGVSCIGLALSDDGVNFNRTGNFPILKADAKYEGISVMNPCVLWDDSVNKFKMWYSAGETYEPDVICYAESRDGFSWEKAENAVLEKKKENRWECYKVGGCNVIKNEDGSYDMYYIGYQNLDVARICKARSKDGINWTQRENNLILSPQKSGWDSDAVYKPSVVRVHGKEYLWYNGRRNHEEYIGLATRSF